MKSYGVTIQMKAIEQYFPVVLFIMLYKVVLTFESVDEILWCDHSNESYWAVLSWCAVYYAVQGNLSFWVCGWSTGTENITIPIEPIHKTLFKGFFLFFISLVMSK